jgi:hypothetical protein
MPTSNITITKSWTQVADNTGTELLITWSSPANVEFAATSAAVVPTIVGHTLDRESAITRNSIGSGFIWAKLVARSGPNSLLLVVSK